MAKDKIPHTPAIRMLNDRTVDYTPRPYKYEERGGTKVSARELCVDEHQVIKTLVMEDEHKTPLIILMHGDKSVSTKSLARAIGAKTIQPCDPKVAHKHTGYMVGGTSPFGTRKALPKIFINAGRKGFLVEMSPQELNRVLSPTPVTVAY
jgi:Cys-tRNA(Pro) deacylase